MRRLCVVILLLGGCGSGSNFTDCKLGQLTGTWRLSYSQTNGNCGPIADETVNTSAPPGGGASCTIAARSISADKCHFEADFTCPTTDNAGTQHWVIVMDQVASNLIDGTGTVQLQHPLGTCRSTYDLSMRQL